MTITSLYNKRDKAVLRKDGDKAVIGFFSNPSKHRMKILHKIYAVGDATCSELEELLNLTHQTVSARISELKKDNVITETGEKRLTKSKCPARVYKRNEVNCVI